MDDSTPLLLRSKTAVSGRRWEASAAPKTAASCGCRSWRQAPIRAAPAEARPRSRDGPRRNPARRHSGSSDTRTSASPVSTCRTRQQRDHQYRPRTAITHDLRQRRPPDEAVEQSRSGRPAPPVDPAAHPRLANCRSQPIPAVRPASSSLECSARGRDASSMVRTRGHSRDTGRPLLCRLAARKGRAIPTTDCGAPRGRSTWRAAILKGVGQPRRGERGVCPAAAPIRGQSRLCCGSQDTGTAYRLSRAPAPARVARLAGRKRSSESCCDRGAGSRAASVKITTCR